MISELLLLFSTLMNKCLIFFIPLLLLLFSCSTTKSSFTKSDVKRTANMYNLEFSENNIDTMYNYLERNRKAYDTMRSYPVPVDVFPAILFDPLPKQYVLPKGNNCFYQPEAYTKPSFTDDELAFMSVAELASLIKSQKISSSYLTTLYIKRIKKYDPILHAVVTLIEEEALSKAKKADEEIKNGNYRGPLHGIPYGVKDLVSVRGYPTTWGAMPYKDQTLDHTATIVKKLEEAGAILIAKLTSGALARGDVWWGGQTMNPWDTLQGASGSSAGSGSATSAGLVGFSIGTETLGSITSPSTRNGVTGLRPTYGRVSRDGIMSLSWSMDKVGPICRSAEDCILVFQVIQGSDPNDPTLYDVPFCFDENQNLENLNIGYLKTDFEKDTTERGGIALQIIDTLMNLGIDLVPDSLPTDLPFNAFDIILRAEAGAFFDDLVHSGKVDMMVEQTQRSRANSLRQSRFIPAVEYIQANRHRKILIEKMDLLMQKYDVLISPTFGNRQLVITNLTGHPVVCVPTGLDKEGHPTSITFVGRLFEEEKILALAKMFQDRTHFDELKPPLFTN
jgi:Asp-tRNA(Asn)/Glu-tRNA(Gln) amidotransferase A subunit family amidase